MTNFKKIAKRLYKRYDRAGEDKLAESLICRGRTVSDGEGWKDFGFILPEDIVHDYDTETGEWATYLDLTEQEINEWIGDNMFVRIFSDYDCTGRPFTVDITWHRNPCGLISYVHTMAIDI